MTKQELKDQMISQLVELELEVNYSDRSFIREVLCSGIKGYDNLTDQELINEYEQICDDMGGRDILNQFKLLMTVKKVVE